VKFAEINEAYNVLKGRMSKTEYDIHFKEYGGPKKSSKQAKYQAGELYNTALKAIKIRDVNSAIDLLKAAVRLESDKAEYYSALGMALSEKPRRLHEAREMCEKAVEMEPYDVENYIRLGLVYKKAGLLIRARKQFETALQWEPNHAVALQELGLSRSQEWVIRVKGLLRKVLGLRR
jgi:tetratricopeptide (TPR) repeat protein